MFNEAIRYIFWILLAVPILILGIYFFVNITNSILVRYKEDEKIIKEKKEQQRKRREFEESYSRRRGGK